MSIVIYVSDEHADEVLRQALELEKPDEKLEKKQDLQFLSVKQFTLLIHLPA